ncbi:putative RNA methylase [Giardia muris]|uniref:Putative RNA methylase n=1 Tax=Giardia muris TaxID=5742 RepID=A0A4Z1T2Q8_GIAMU|nr:putative RNA methylase [Giardia muris]|eukprot:TNJ28233.1 putative RNA methylase [Giardia muris]
MLWVANFAEILTEFHLPTFTARAECLGLQVEPRMPYSSPVLLFTTPGSYVDTFRTIEGFLSSLILLKEYGLLLAEGTSYEELILDPTALDARIASSLSDIAAIIGKDVHDLTFGFGMNVVGQKVQNSKKVEQYHQIIGTCPSLLPLACNLRTPDVRFVIVDDQLSVQRGIGERRLFLVLQSSLYREGAMRLRLHGFNLPTRCFIGPTSMDPELAFIMCEVAKVKSGYVVCDPFAGTCSILVSAAFYGCIAVGGDLDIKILRGKGGKQHYSQNFISYGLPQPLLSLHDAHKPAYRQEVFDAILCDPPYSIRAGARVANSRAGYGFKNIADKENVADLFLAVLDFAALTLRVGGRLAFWLPYLIEYHEDSDIPQHADFELVTSPSQKLTGGYGRRLCVFERRRRSEPSVRASYSGVPSHRRLTQTLGYIRA